MKNSLAGEQGVRLLGRMADDLPSSIVAGIAFIRRSAGRVNALDGFKKSHHTIPDTANAVTNGFLGKICAGELNAEAENLFQAVRKALGYKRTEVSLSVSSPAAALTTRDFVVDYLYGLQESTPSYYEVTTTLHSLKNPDLARTEEFAAIFAGWFTELSFGLAKGAKVEAVVDAIEALDGALEVSYPSDCSDCQITLAGVDATVRCTPSSLEIVFPRGGSPRELMDQFAEVRSAFAITRELSGLIG